ncbi:MAG: ATP-binding protein [Spirochaetes bacterium]|nr:ATP-binding protein [Spirochaetota bacterium]
MRRRVFFVIGLTLLAMILVIAAATRLVLMQSLLDLERSYLERDVDQVRKAVAEDLAALRRTARDWSAWDDAYEFAATRSPGFVARNLADEMLSDINVSAILFVDAHGRLVYGKTTDAAGSGAADLAAEIARYAADHPALLAHDSPDASVAGIAALPEGTTLVAAWPILDSSRTQPARGTLLMCRLLTSEDVREIGRRVNLSVARLSLGDPQLPAGLAGDAVVIEAFGRDRVAAYGLLKDFDGQPAVAFRVFEPADFRRQGVIMLFALLAWVTLTGLSFGAAVFFFLERAVLSRLHALSAGVLAIGTADEPGRRLALAGRDEFAYLGAAINGMLDSLERSNADLLKMEQRNEAFLGAVPDLFFRVDREGTIVDARLPAGVSRLPASNRLVGANARDLPGIWSRIDPKFIERGMTRIRDTLATGVPQSIEFTLDDDPPRTWECRTAPIGGDEVLVLVRDVTAERRAAEAQRKEILLKEIHHRVKNNLQVISSLLDLQARAARDDETRRLLSESQGRVRSMALIHERLYGSGSDAVDFADYARDLVTHLRHSLSGDSGRIAVAVDVEDVALDMDVSVPCGLVINELLTNALTHAFPEGRAGSVAVSLRRRPGGSLELRVADDGVGLPPEVDPDNPGTLGLRIVHILSAQIQGTLETVRCPADGRGTAFSLVFPDPSGGPTVSG